MILGEQSAFFMDASYGSKNIHKIYHDQDISSRTLLSVVLMFISDQCRSTSALGLLKNNPSTLPNKAFIVLSFLCLFLNGRSVKPPPDVWCLILRFWPAQLRGEQRFILYQEFRLCYYWAVNLHTGKLSSDGWNTKIPFYLRYVKDAIRIPSVCMGGARASFFLSSWKTFRRRQTKVGVFFQ